MTAVLRYAALLTLLVLPVACVAPTTPSALRRQQPISQPPPPAQPPPVPAPPPEQPPLTGPNTAYVFSGPLSYPVSGYTRESKFVLYDSGAFAFTYPRSRTILAPIIGKTAALASIFKPMARRMRRAISRMICWRSDSATGCTTQISRTLCIGGLSDF